MSDLQVIYRPTSTLIPYARNARTHSEAQVQQLAGSIQEFGFTNPVLVDGTSTIIAGHGRVLAAQLLGLGQVPTIELSHLSDAQRRAYILADNRMALSAGWDDELLAIEFGDLELAGFDLALTGFDADEVSAILDADTPLEPDADTEPQDDRAEELRDQWGTETGQMWKLGDHLLLCGDCTLESDVLRVMGAERHAACVTDPPYGIGGTVSDKNNYDDYDDTKEALMDLVPRFMALAHVVADRVIVTPGNGNQSLYAPPTWTMAWFTPAGVGRGPWGFACWQPILCYGKDPRLASGQGCHPDALVHTESSESLGHPCSKPINFWSWLVERTTDAGAAIYEPFSGSGTTIIACENLKRRCHALEISPAYVAVALQRWADHTQQTPVLIDE